MFHVSGPCCVVDDVTSQKLLKRIFVVCVGNVVIQSTSFLTNAFMPPMLVSVPFSPCLSPNQSLGETAVVVVIQSG